MVMGLIYFFFIEIFILADKQVDNALAVHTRDGESLIHKLNEAAFKKKIKVVCWGGDSLLCEIFHWVLSKAIQHVGNTLREPLKSQGLTKRAGELLPHLNRDSSTRASPKETVPACPLAVGYRNPLLWLMICHEDQRKTSPRAL